ncbi:hypothetical protein IQ61_04935 [Streptomyces scabiei]|nr:hypothetical protein IQ61_04935 [Streptomyces scabiei]
MRCTPDTVMAGWHSFRGAVLTVRAGFGMSDAEAARSVVLARQALEPRKLGVASRLDAVAVGRELGLI